MPSQIPFIIANEGCERFSFYGMRNILVPFLTASAMFRYLPEASREGSAKDVFHTFVIGVYFFPLLGGWLADRFFGKYNTILWFSLIYSIGQGCLALFVDQRVGFYTGLGLIALGSGGIKPLVASFMGDQFDARTKHLAKLVFDGFYWIINFGSFFASLLMPLFLKKLYPQYVFGIPGVLMLIATLVFWLARGRYVMVPVAPRDPDSFSRVAATALRSGGPGLALAVTGAILGLATLALFALDYLEIVPTLCLALAIVLGFGGVGTYLQLERARGKHPDVAVDGVRAVLRVLVVFALITPFWSLFDQKASTWVIQAKDMAKPTWFEPAMMQALNPALVMLLLPFNNFVLYPWMRRRGREPSALGRMTLGLALAGVAWIIVTIMQLLIDGGSPFSIVWQIIPYAFLTMAEVLVSATGLEFAYSQAPASMKGAIMSFFNLSVTMGNLWVLLSDAAIRNSTVTGAIARTGFGTTAFLMAFFAAFALVAAAVFRLYARGYREVDHYRRTT